METEEQQQIKKTHKYYKIGIYAFVAFIILYIIYVVVVNSNEHEQRLTTHQNAGIIEYTRGNFSANVTLQINISGFLLNVSSDLFYRAIGNNSFKFGWDRTFTIPAFLSNRNVTARYIIDTNQDIVLNGNVIYFEDNYVSFNDMCVVQYEESCPGGLHVNSSAVGCFQEVVSDPRCSLSQTRNNEIIVDFSVLYNATVNRILIDPIFGVLNDEVILQDDFSNTTADSQVQEIQYGSSGWNNVGVASCTYTGAGFMNCTSNSDSVGERGFFFDPENTTTCKYTCQTDNVSGYNTSLYSGCRGSIQSGGSNYCDVIIRQDDWVYFENEVNTTLLAGVVDNTEYTIYIINHRGNSTCDFYVSQTGDTTVNAAINGTQYRTLGGTNAIDRLVLQNEAQGASTNLIDYAFCWNGTRADDPSSNLNDTAMNLTLNGFEANITVFVNTDVNVTAERIEGESNIELYQDEILMNNDTLYVSNITTLWQAKTVNFTIFHAGTSNYVVNFTTWFVEVIDFMNNLTDPELPSMRNDNFIISIEANNSFTGENITRMEINVAQPNGTLIADNQTMMCVELSEDNHQLCNYTITHEKIIASAGDNWTYNITLYKDGGENSTFIPDTAFTVQTPVAIEVFSPSNASTQTSTSISMNFTVGGGEYCSPSCFDTCLYNITRGDSIEVATTNITCNTNVTLSMSSDLTTYLLTTFVNDSNGNENSTTSTFRVDTTGVTPGTGGGSGGGGGTTIIIGTGASTGNCDVTVPEKIVLTHQSPIGSLPITNNQNESISTLISIEPPIGALQADGSGYLSFPSTDLQPILPGQTLPISIRMDIEAIRAANVTTDVFARIKIPGANDCADYVIVEMQSIGFNLGNVFRRSLVGLFQYPQSLTLIGGALIAIYLVIRRPKLKEMSIIKKTMFVSIVTFSIGLGLIILVNIVRI